MPACFSYPTVTPLLLSLYITWEVETETDSQPVRGSLEDVLVAVCLARCYRWVGHGPAGLWCTAGLPVWVVRDSAVNAGVMMWKGVEGV